MLTLKKEVNQKANYEHQN